MRAVYSARVLLRLPISDPALLGPFVEQCLEDNVVLIAIHGEACEAAEDQIDDLIVGEGSNDRFIVTTSHPGETLTEVLEFATLWPSEDLATVQIVTL